MSSIFETVTINARIEAVFDLISRVEDFPLYARALIAVRKIDHDTYRWQARVRGVSLTWDSIITERRWPTRIAWRSIRGFENSGAYTLTPGPAGTTVSLCIHYNFSSHVLETLISPLLEPITRSLAADVLARVKNRLEYGSDRQPPAAGSIRPHAAALHNRHSTGHAR